MRSELLCITVNISDPEMSFTEKLLVPSSMIKLFAEFLLQRDDEEYFLLAGFKVQFSDCNVQVEDSTNAINAYKILSKYMDISSRDICADIAKYTEDTNKEWKNEPEYVGFMHWYESITKSKSE